MEAETLDNLMTIRVKRPSVKSYDFLTPPLLSTPFGMLPNKVYRLPQKGSQMSHNVSTGT